MLKRIAQKDIRELGVWWAVEPLNQLWTAIFRSSCYMYKTTPLSGYAPRGSVLLHVPKLSHNYLNY